MFSSFVTTSAKMLASVVVARTNTDSVANRIVSFTCLMFGQYMSGSSEWF